MKYNSTEVITKDGSKLYFITRGRAKPFSKEEVEEYLDSISLSEEDDTPWEPHNVDMFLTDLRSGPQFVASKYAVTVEEVEHYVRTKLSHMNLSAWRKNG